MKRNKFTIILFLVGMILVSCSQNTEKKSLENDVYNQKISRCYDDPKALIENDTIVEDCLKSVIKEYPKEVQGYLFLAELLHERGDVKNLVELQNIMDSLFTTNSKFLFQKNFFMITDSIDFNIKDIKILVKRKDENELTNQENSDLIFLLKHLYSNRSKIQDNEKKLFIEDYFTK